MKFLFARILSLCLFVGLLFPAFIESNTGWSYIQSTQQSFYIFMSPMDIVDVLGNQIEGYGDGSNSQTTDESDCGLNPESCDVIGAFMSRDIDQLACSDAGGYYVNGQCDVCVGWSYYNSYSEGSVGTISTTLALVGEDDPNHPIVQHYCSDGEIPKLKFFDSSSGIIYELIDQEILPPFENFEISILSPDCSDIPDCIDYQSVAIEDDPLSNSQSEIPSNFTISSVFPNPFNPSVNITFSVTTLEHVNISVYNATGRHIATLFNGYKEHGTHELVWTPEISISSGNYIIMMETPNNISTSKVTFLK